MSIDAVEVEKGIDAIGASGAIRLAEDLTVVVSRIDPGRMWSNLVGG